MVSTIGTAQIEKSNKPPSFLMHGVFVDVKHNLQHRKYEPELQMLAGAREIHPRTRKLAMINTMTEPLHQNQEKALLLKTICFISHEVTIDNAHRPEPDGTEERTKQNPNQQPMAVF